MYRCLHLIIHIHTCIYIHMCVQSYTYIYTYICYILTHAPTHRFNLQTNRAPNHSCMHTWKNTHKSTHAQTYSQTRARTLREAGIMYIRMYIVAPICTHTYIHNNEKSLRYWIESPAAYMSDIVEQPPLVICSGSVMCVYMHVCVFKLMQACFHICQYACQHMSYVSLYVYMYKYVYLCMYVYTYISSIYESIHIHKISLIESSICILIVDKTRSYRVATTHRMPYRSTLFSKRALYLMPLLQREAYT